MWKISSCMCSYPTASACHAQSLNFISVVHICLWRRHVSALICIQMKKFALTPLIGACMWCDPVSAVFLYYSTSEVACRSTIPERLFKNAFSANWYYCEITGTTWASKGALPFYGQPSTALDEIYASGTKLGGLGHSSEFRNAASYISAPSCTQERILFRACW